MTGPRPLPAINDIVPYKGGEKPKHAGGHKLSSNENPLGCSPAARAALIAAADGLEVYPDGGAFELRSAIAETYGLDKDRIIVGAGSDEIFQLLGRAYLSPGDEIIQTEHGFLVYRLVAQQAGAKTISAPETELTTSVDAILERVTERTRIIFLANPNNPTGTYLPYEEIQRLHAGLREDILLVLDGAYAEFVRRNDFSAGVELAGSAPNVLMTRTFSKIHGLAALRVGWGYGPSSVIEALHKVRGPFNVSGPGQAAATAAIRDRGFIDASADHNAAELTRLTETVSELGFEVVPSVANFALIRFTSPEEAQAMDAFTRERGIVLRRLEAYGLPACLRLSVGTMDANDAVIAAFEEFERR
ncbi:MAG: histidinol-phosphate transaminase [Hyphomonadaceae bacterium]|nr:histidinol-phosphate transaminase [Hyphomonadaceae bacterium]